MLGPLPGKIKQTATSLQRWNFYHQNTGITVTYSKSPKRGFHCRNILKTTTKSFWKHRGNWQPVLFTAQTKKKTFFFQFYMKRNLKKSYIKHSKSKVAQPVMFVPKKNGELKMCVDYRKINAVTVKNKYPLPLMADMKTKLRDARYFTILDLRDASNFIRIIKNEWKTAFRTKYGIYEYLIMPFGLINAPATMQKMFNKTLQSYLDRFAIIYINDILVYSDTKNQHIEYVKMILEALRQKNLKIKIEKCRFHVKKVTFLGFVITPRNIQMETTKMDSIQTWPAPRNIKNLQKLLRFMGFYQNMIPKYAEWTSSMTDFLQKGKELNGDQTRCQDWQN